MKPIPLDLALRVAQRLCDDAGVALILPGDPRREVVLYALAALHTLRGSGWSLATARERVSVTVPGVGLALRVLAGVPVVGSALAALAGDSARPMVMLSPAALHDGVTLLGVVQHEIGHVASLRAGGPLWCLAYGAVPEVVAAAEAPCYGADVALTVRLGGVDVDAAVVSARASLAGYGLDDRARRLAEGQLSSVAETLRQGGDPGGIVADTLAALAAEGWAP